jgi:hypothetical protein
MLDPASIAVIVSSVIGAVSGLIIAIINRLKKPAPPDNPLGLKPV